MNVTMYSVDSSNVAKVGYDEINNDVYVRFLDGSLYIYYSVPIIQFENLKNASSVGSYLHQNFKGIYEYKKLE